MKVSQTHGEEREPKKFCHFPESKKKPEDWRRSSIQATKSCRIFFWLGKAVHIVCFTSTLNPDKWPKTVPEVRLLLHAGRRLTFRWAHDMNVVKIVPRNRYSVLSLLWLQAGFFLCGWGLIAVHEVDEVGRPTLNKEKGNSDQNVLLVMNVLWSEAFASDLSKDELCLLPVMLNPIFSSKREVADP